MIGCGALAPGLLIVGLALAQGEPSPDADKAFASLWEAAVKDPRAADFARIRAAYVRTSRYKPYSYNRDEEAKARKAIDGEDYAEAGKIVDSLLEAHPLDLDARLLAAFLRRKAGDEAGEATQVAIFQCLLEAILDGRDGKAPGSAYPVIDVREEYAILQFLGARRESQALRAEGGHRYDVLTVTDRKTKAKRDVFFNIDAPMNALGKSLKIDLPDPPEDSPR